MASTIIECRNKDSENIISNGDWTTSLNENILIEDGDEIIIKDSYIDTQQTSSQKIALEEDLRLIIDAGFYQPDLRQEQYIPYGGGAVAAPTFRNRILCREIVGGAGHSIVKNYVLTTLNKGEESQKVDITFSWTSPDAELDNSRKLNIPALLANEKITLSRLVGVFLVQADGISTDKALSDYGLKIEELSYTDASAYLVQIPYTRKIEITIPKGNYTGDQITELINFEVNQNDLSGSEFPTTDENLLQTARQIQSRFHSGAVNTSEFTICDPLTGLGALDPYKIEVMKDYPTTTGNVYDIFFGGSIFEISYDTPSSQFSIKYAHTPFYYQSQIAIQLNADASNLIYSTNKANGNFFYQLSAINIQSGTVNNFWSETLGFDLEEVLPTFNYKTHSVGPSNLLIPETNQIIDGVSITGGNNSVDGLVDKSDPYKVNTTYPQNISTDAGTTVSIVGNSSNALDQQSAFAYYLIEINSQFKNEFLTPDNNYRNIQQIVNRYYELNSYTSGQDGQIIYQHKGEPILLQSFHCRILTSDKELAPNIGDDNTIHIEVIKGSQAPQAKPADKTK